MQWTRSRCGAVFQHHNSVHVFDISIHRWSRPTFSMADVPPPRLAHTMVLYQSKIWVFGGGKSCRPWLDHFVYSTVPRAHMAPIILIGHRNVPTRTWGRGELFSSAQLLSRSPVHRPLGRTTKTSPRSHSCLILPRRPPHPPISKQ